MINELYQLSTAMSGAGVQQTSWHRKYMPIPNVSPKTPCIRIVLEHCHIRRLESLTAETASHIRKYGSNQGTFPAMNLVPLYRLRDPEKKKLLSDILAGKKECPDVDEIRSWCQINNWDTKFQKKYGICAVKAPEEIAQLLKKGNVTYGPFSTIVDEMSELSNVSLLRRELEKHAFSILEARKDMRLGLQILFYPEKDSEKGEDKATSNLSVIFDAEQLADARCAVISQRFTEGFNRVLLQADGAVKSSLATSEQDAFGLPFAPVGEPMPRVQLVPGFVVSLRTMYGGQPCQTRYGETEDETYPISPVMRTRLQSALDWISRPDREEKTWIRTNKDEFMFAYPVDRPNSAMSYTSLFGSRKTKDGASSFQKTAKGFIEEVIKGKRPGTDPRSERIQIMFLRKLDRARTKAVYSYNTTPAEIEAKAEIWTAGCNNIPDLSFWNPNALFPLHVSELMNQFWKQNGEPATDKCHPTPVYHGLELLFGPKELVRKDLAALMLRLTALAPCLQGDFMKNEELSWRLKGYVKSVFPLLGLYLYKLDYRKENYMTEFPYLFGQLLKISDALHEKYCLIVRSPDEKHPNIPPQLAGSALYTAAAEHPFRTLALLGQRMNPYITWARSYQCKGITIKDKESKLIGWYLSLYEKTATQLMATWGPQTRLNDEEKAALFIGYLAAFPKKESNLNENGGNENEQ